MSPTQTRGPRGDENLQGPEQFQTMIRDHVLRALGGLIGAGRVQVRPLWDHYYRVNIIVGDGPGCVTIPSSYFLKTDGAGHVLESTPKLTKRD